MEGWDRKRGAARHYDRSAAVYDAQYAEEQGAKIEAALRHLSLRGDSVVLDVGCGTGLLLERIGESVGLLVGLDISLGVLQEARGRVRSLPRVGLVRADADFTPFPDGTFDRVFAVTLLQNMPGPLSTLSEVRRVAKRGSTIVITGLKKAFSLDAFEGLLRAAGLRASILKTDDQLKEYVAVCEG